MNETSDTTNAAATSQIVSDGPVRFDDSPAFGIAVGDIAEQHAMSPDGAIETKTYDDGTVATGPGPLPDDSPAATPLDEARAADVEQPTPELIISGCEVTGLGYVLNLHDIENIARIEHDAHRDMTLEAPFDELDEDQRNEKVTAVADALDEKPNAIALSALALQVASAIKDACDNLIDDFLRMPVELEQRVAHRVADLLGDEPKAASSGIKTVEQARALPLVSIEDIASVYEDGAPGDIEAFKDADGTTRRVVVMPDFTLAKA